jgi:hypothetical protein
MTFENQLFRIEGTKTKNVWIDGNKSTQTLKVPKSGESGDSYLHCLTDSDISTSSGESHF